MSDARPDPDDRLLEKALEEALRAVADLSAAVVAQQQTIAALAAVVASFTPTQPLATRLGVTVSKGPEPMTAVLISIDDAAGTINWAWEDDRGDTDAAAPLDASGAPVTVTAGSDNAAVATVGASDQSAKSAPITPVAEGDWNATVTVTDSTGAPAVWPADAPGGVAGTPIVSAAVACQVGPGIAGALVASAKA
ncbi:MAG: hypothetical protein V4472_24930 [Pseudomonadota bacterium]